MLSGYFNREGCRDNRKGLEVYSLPRVPPGVEVGEVMRAEIILDCCGYEVKTCSKSYEYIDCYKSVNFFKKKLSDGRAIKKELLLVAVCPNCGHWILKYLWYSKLNSRFQDWDESKIIRGKKADEIFSGRTDDYILIELPDPFQPKEEVKQSNKIPWVYGKTIDAYSQIPRYLDESEDAGLKITNPIKVTKI